MTKKKSAKTRRAKKAPLPIKVLPATEDMGIHDLFSNFGGSLLDQIIDAQDPCYMEIFNDSLGVFARNGDDDKMAIEMKVREILKGGYAPMSLDGRIMQRLENDPYGNDYFCVQFFDANNVYQFSVASRDIDF